ncbi:hypothetical protein BS78_01G293600 [Paspalum vaginatum]|nr:hypothetical protein BS78_01G293600 [Paspalum vaginatum]
MEAGREPRRPWDRHRRGAGHQPPARRVLPSSDTTIANPLRLARSTYLSCSSPLLLCLPRLFPSFSTGGACRALTDPYLDIINRTNSSKGCDGAEIHQKSRIWFCMSPAICI